MKHVNKKRNNSKHPLLQHISPTTVQVIDEYLLSQIIKIAFECGESWGVCYSTWFSPSEEDKQQRLLDARTNVKKQLKEKLRVPLVVGEPKRKGD